MRLEKVDQVQGLHQWEDGESRDFELALERFSAFIRANILRFGLDRKGIDPEDVIQDVRLKLWKKLGVEKKGAFRTSYIKKVIDSTLIDLLRRTRVERDFLRPENQEILRRSGALREGTEPDRSSQERVRAAVDGLTEEKRRVVKLFLMDMTIEEISLALNWTKDKTRNLLYRGLEEVKRQIRQRGA